MREYRDWRFTEEYRQMIEEENEGEEEEEEEKEDDEDNDDNDDDTTTMEEEEDYHWCVYGWECKLCQQEEEEVEVEEYEVENEPSIVPVQAWDAAFGWEWEEEEEEEEKTEAAFEKAWREEAARRLQRIQEASKGGTHPRTEEDDEETDAELCVICRDFDCQCPPVFVEALEAFRSP